MSQKVLLHCIQTALICTAKDRCSQGPCGAQHILICRWAAPLAFKHNILPGPLACMAGLVPNWCFAKLLSMLITLLDHRNQ